MFTDKMLGIYWMNTRNLPEILILRGVPTRNVLYFLENP